MVDPFALLPPADAARIVKLSCVRNASSAEVLAGGITNRNYKVTTPAGIVVVRLSDAGSSALAIDRDNEHLNSISAAVCGAGAPVIEYLPEAGALVVGWIEGQTFTEADVRNPVNLPRIAAACRLLHAGPRFVSDFNMFDIQARYLSLVQAEGYRLPARYLDLMPAFARMRGAMEVRPEPAVPCNNDLLAANFIDGGDKLWLIDYEYSGNNEASFELGNIWSESTLPLNLLDVLVESYWGQHLPGKTARARLWGLASQYGWTLWAAIQTSISPIDFDYWAWGMEKYDRAVAEFDSPGFERLLLDVATGH